VYFVVSVMPLIIDAGLDVIHVLLRKVLHDSPKSLTGLTPRDSGNFPVLRFAILAEERTMSRMNKEQRLAQRVRIELAKRALSRNKVFQRMRNATSAIGRTRFFNLLSGQDSDCAPFSSKEVGELAKAIGVSKKRLTS